MTSQELLLWIGVVTLILIAFFIFGKHGYMHPSKLNLNSKSRLQLQLRSEESFASTDAGIEEVRSLNVLFLYKGNNFDAYEVLGLPAGIQMEVVRSTYALKRKQAADLEAIAFIDSAYQAIRQEHLRKS